MRRYAILVLLFVAAVLYGSLLSRTPIHLNQDELGFSLNAYSIAKTGFDENGRFLPLYFWHLGVMWSTPLIVYLTSLFLLFLPLAENTIRLASVTVGLLNIFLVYLLAKRIFKKEIYGLLAAGFLALTPVHFIHSRVLLDNLFIVPFILLWLLFLFDFFKTGSQRKLFLAGIALGIGVHSYHAAKAVMPFYFLLTCLAAFPRFKENKRLFLVLLTGFILPLLPLIPWLKAHPDTFVDQVRYTQIYDYRQGLSGVLSLLSPESLLLRAKVYLAYFNPNFLFLRGDVSLIHSTRLAGVFLLSYAAFLPLGILRLFKKRTKLGVLILIGFFTFPLAAALVGNYYRISRVLVVLPFATLLAVYGLEFLVSKRKKLWKYLALLLFLAIPIQFFFFLYDYHKGYRLRSYRWFNFNIPEAMQTTLEEAERAPTSLILIDRDIYFAPKYWKFYLLKNNKEELFSKTHFFDPNPQLLDLYSFPEQSVLLFNFNHVDGLKEEVGPFRKLHTIVEPDGTSRFYIYRN